MKNKPGLKIIKGGNDDLISTINALQEAHKEGKIKGVAIVSIEKDDAIYTDWSKDADASIFELIGGVRVLEQEILNFLEYDEV